MAKKSINDILKYLWPATQRDGIQIDRIPFLQRTREQSVDQLRERFVKRTQKCPYPFVPSRRAGEKRGASETMFDRLQSKNVMELLLSEEVLAEIKCALDFFEIEKRRRSLVDVNKPKTAHARQFHRAMAFALLQHALQVRKLLKSNGVQEDWIRDHLRTTDEQMRKEVQALRPEYPFGLLPQLGAAWNEVVLSVFDTVTAAFTKAGLARRNKTLAYELTAMTCSRSDFFDSVANPTPEAVRRTVERRSD